MALWPEVMSAPQTLPQKLRGKRVRRAWTGGQGWEPLAGNADNMPNWLVKTRPAEASAGDERVRSHDAPAWMRRRVADSQRAAAAHAWRDHGQPGAELLDTLRPRRSSRRMHRGPRQNRDAWLEEVPESWLEANAFYEGAIEALRAVVEVSRPRRTSSPRSSGASRRPSFRMRGSSSMTIASLASAADRRLRRSRCSRIAIRTRRSRSWRTRSRRCVQWRTTSISSPSACTSRSGVTRPQSRRPSQRPCRASNRSAWTPI